jgi:hypothetical protein
MYWAVKASLHVPSTAPHGAVVGLPHHYTRWLDTRTARTPCRTEPEQFSHLSSSYATRRHHKLHGLQLKVRMSLVAILRQANLLFILTPYFFTTPVIIPSPNYYQIVLLQAYTFFIRTMHATCPVEFTTFISRYSLKTFCCVGVNSEF